MQPLIALYCSSTTHVHLLQAARIIYHRPCSNVNQGLSCLHKAITSEILVSKVMGLYLSHGNDFDHLPCQTNVILLQEISVDHYLFHAETLMLSTCPHNISSSNYDDSEGFYFDDSHQTMEQEEVHLDHGFALSRHPSRRLCLGRAAPRPRLRLHRLRSDAPPTSKVMPL